MKLSQMIDEIYLLVKDDSFFDTDAKKEDITRRINDAVKYACGHPGVEVPALRKMGSFTTEEGVAYATISGIASNFTGRILRVGEPGKVKIYQALEDLYDDYYPLDREGDVEAVCVVGNTMWYQGIPTAATQVICVLQDDPEAVTFDATGVLDPDIPLIPDALQLRVIAHYVAMDLYDKIEDGIDGQKANKINSQREHSIGLQKWMEFLGQRRQHNKTSHWRY
jgi:hypothetical protein